MNELILNITINGSTFWYKNDPTLTSEIPHIFYDPEKKMYIYDGRVCLHREDGPAQEWSNGKKEWYINNLRHREDGPAIEYADGTVEWWYNDVKYNVSSVEELMIAVLLK